MPGSASVVDVMPLDAKAISSFLHSRFETYHLPPGIDRPAYEALCDAFLEKHIGEKVPEERRKINQRILSNPFDLTIAGQLIAGAGGRSLNILSLQQEYYDQMTRAFTQTNPHRQAFPIERFSEAVFQLMLKDDARLPYDDFPEEIACMRLFKMVVSREIKDGEDKSWYFRHDKIRDFFVLQVFVEHGEHQVTYIGDPRFRGVYFLLAGYLPLEQAEELERELVIYAGESNDYSLSSEFIRHMRDRRKRTA